MELPAFLAETSSCGSAGMKEHVLTQKIPALPQVRSSPCLAHAFSSQSHFALSYNYNSAPSCSSCQYLWVGLNVHFLLPHFPFHG